jgi:hypothetical protein
MELQKLRDNLARLSNGSQHTEARAAAMHLMSCWRGCDIPSLFHGLVGEPRLPATIDWVNDVAKRFAAFALLKGFGFSMQKSLSLLPEIENLVKLMVPVGSNEEVESILASVRSVQEAFDIHFAGKLPSAQAPALYLANFVGLLIQSYDATRGLLSNSLLHAAKAPELKSKTEKDFIGFVRESARLDPAVHNTRRTMHGDVTIGKYKIKSGEEVLIVLASANRDAGKFLNPDAFVLDRANDALSFGSGLHKCIADNFATQLAASLLHYLHMKYSKFAIQEAEIPYEPRVNIRLPKKITLTIS